jgi:hypothetical protein
MELPQPTSGVGVLTHLLGDDVPLIEKWFPLPKEPPLRFEKAFYPKFTDALFTKAIADLAGKTLTESDLTRSASYARLNPEQKKLILALPVEESFLQLEPQFSEYPEIVQTFLETARRYVSPYPKFEVDFRYGAADILCGTTLIEMKAYSVMTYRDLVHARNQVLIYACLAMYTPGFSTPIRQIEVVNSLTGQVWSWNTSEFFRLDLERLYWIVIYPLMAQKELPDGTISQIKTLLETAHDGIVNLAKTIHLKENMIQTALLRRVHQLEQDLKSEIIIRRNVVNKYKALKEKHPEERHSEEEEDSAGWVDTPEFFDFC